MSKPTQGKQQKWKDLPDSNLNEIKVNRMG